MKNIDPSEINIINYLSGEMSAEELKQFELQLEENQLLSTQVEEMKEVQDQLGIWGNEDIQIPIFEPESLDTVSTQDNKRSSNLKNKRTVKYFIPNWVKYAASFLGFVLLLQITGLKINQKGNALMLSFGQPEVENMNTLDVDAIVASAIEKYAAAQNNQLKDFKNQVNSDLNELNNTVKHFSVSNESNISQLQRTFNLKLDNQYDGFQSMIKASEANQRQELEDSFTGFVQFIENKRVTDQIKLQNAFSDIATAINNQQYQTNALLTSFSVEDSNLKSY